jgi:hypothetical protein
MNAKQKKSRGQVVCCRGQDIHLSAEIRSLHREKIGGKNADAQISLTKVPYSEDDGKYLCI